MARPKIATEKILDAALAPFIEKGYHNATITDLCKEVGCPVGSIYYRFSGKQEIAGTVYRRVVEQFQAGLVDLAIAGVSDPAAGVQACITHVLDHVEQHPHDAKFLLLLRHRDFLGAKDLKLDTNRHVVHANEKVYNWSRQLHAKLVERLGKDAPSYDTMFSLVFDLPMGYAKRWMNGQATAAPHEIRGEMVRAALRGLGLER